jgi:phosphomannomutase
MFVCPGSTVPITRSVHLSRLRRGFEDCIACPHREELGQLRPPKAASPSSESHASTWLRDGGIRAPYLNELTRPVMARLAEAVATMLWNDLGGPVTKPDGPCPVVVVGRDSRPMSADLAAGAVAGLRRMGCHVIEVGELTRPEFWFATRHLEAFAGLWVNGVGADANCGGFDVVQGGRCWSSPGRLQELWSRRDLIITRPQNRKGTLATFQTSRIYLASLQKHFHAFRPLTILLASGEPLLKSYFKSLLAESPINVLWEHHARLVGSGLEEQSSGEVIQEHLYSHRVDAVIAINDDAQTCRFWDEKGREISPFRLLRPMLDMLERRRPSRTSRPATNTSAGQVSHNRSGPNWLRARTAFVRSQGTHDRDVTQSIPVVPSAVPHEDPPRDIAGNESSPIVVGAGLASEAAQMGIDVASGGETLEAMSKAMHEHQARLGLDHRGAFWFDESGPTSDALLSVARMLQWLSSSDIPLSRIWAE